MNLFKENLEGIKEEIETLIVKYNDSYAKLNNNKKLDKEKLGKKLYRKYHFKFVLILARLSCFLKDIEILERGYPTYIAELKKVADKIEGIFTEMKNFEKSTVLLMGKSYKWEYKEENKKEENKNQKNEGKFCKI